MQQNGNREYKAREVGLCSDPAVLWDGRSGIASKKRWREETDDPSKPLAG